VKHFLGYRADGAIVSIEAFHGGWPRCKCADAGCGGLADPSCSDPAVVSLREKRRGSEVVGWVAVVCPCEAAVGTCACASRAAANNYLADERLVTKFDARFFLDGEEVVNRQVVDRVPGSVHKLVIESAAPDGTTIVCGTRGQFDVCEQQQFEVVLTGGRTPEIVLLTPAQGGRGSFGCGGYFVASTAFELRGWAV
jgi:hypothetical protein